MYLSVKGPVIFFHFKMQGYCYSTQTTEQPAVRENRIFPQRLTVKSFRRPATVLKGGGLKNSSGILVCTQGHHLSLVFPPPPVCCECEPYLQLHDYTLASASGSTSFLWLAWKCATFCFPSSPCCSACHLNVKPKAFFSLLLIVAVPNPFFSLLEKDLVLLLPSSSLACSIPAPSLGGFCQMCTVIFLHRACCPNAFLKFIMTY